MNIKKSLTTSYKSLVLSFELLAIILLLCVSVVNVSTAAVYKAVDCNIAVYAYDPNTYSGVTGNDANISATIYKDGQSAGATSDVHPTEIGGGVYNFNISAAEATANQIIIMPSCSASNTWMDPVIIYTEQSLESYGAAKSSELADANTYLSSAIGGIDTNSAKGEIIAAINAIDMNSVKGPNTIEIAKAVWDHNGITAGGNWTAAKILKGIDAWAEGKWMDDPNTPGTYWIMDGEDSNIPVLGVTPAATTPYMTVNRK